MYDTSVEMLYLFVCFLSNLDLVIMTQNLHFGLKCPQIIILEELMFVPVYFGECLSFILFPNDPVNKLLLFSLFLLVMS